MKNYGGDDEAADEMLVAVGCREKRKNIVHNACLLNYYCYLCDGTGEPLSRLRNLTVSLSDFTGA